MKNKIWLYLLVIPATSFGVTWLASMMIDFGPSDLGGLLIMGMLLAGWPVASVWLGVSAGKDLKHRWFLPVLFALTMPMVFPYFNAGVYAWLYAGGILLAGLIAMVGTWWNHRGEQGAA